MKSIMIILAFLVFSLPVCALEQVDDTVLSSVSGPESLNVRNLLTARLAFHSFGLDDEYKGIGKMLMRDMRELELALLYGNEDASDVDASGSSRKGLAFYSKRESNRGIYSSYISTEELESDQAKGDYSISADTIDARVDTYYSLSEPVKEQHSIYYILGNYRTTDEAQYWETKPYGGPVMRDHYIDNATTVIKPNSWVDVKTR